MKASRNASDHPRLIWAKAGSSASIRAWLAILLVSFSMIAMSSGIPTDKFERNVESIDSSAAFCASIKQVSGRTTRSRIGFPYLCSPICRNGVSRVASMKLPSG